MSTRNKVTLKRLAEMYDLKMSWLYEKSRKDELPGMLRLGHLVRVDPDLFEEGVKAGLLATATD